MNILITPDKFKGSLTAQEVCKAIEEGILRYNANVNIKKIPLADGGEGSLEALEKTIYFERVYCKVNNPLGKKIDAYYGIKDNVAYVEMSLASGLQLLENDERNPMLTSSFGTGELINDAVRKGAKQIFLFIGGSATNDGAIGIASALGYKFFDEKNELLEPIGKNLIEIKNISWSEAVALDDVDFIVLTDVINPLYGETGAAHIFAAQKGASEFAISQLDKGLRNFAAVVKDAFGKDISQIPGGGAAGGIGAGICAFYNAEVKSGIESILDMLNINSLIQNSDLVITGEGLFDKQTLEGKVVKGVLDRCKLLNKPAAIICGDTSLSASEIEKGHQKYFKTIKTDDITVDESMYNAYKYLIERVEELIREFVEETT